MNVLTLQSTYGGLLHDTGKAVYRAGGQRGSHSEQGYQFLHGVLSGADWAPALDCVRYHHAAALRGAAAVLCGWLVYAAYMFASAISRYNHRQEVNADMNVLDFVQSGLSGLAQGGANALTVVLITVSCAAILILLSRAAKHRLTRNDLAAMLRGR